MGRMKKIECWISLCLWGEGNESAKGSILIFSFPTSSAAHVVPGRKWAVCLIIPMRGWCTRATVPSRTRNTAPEPPRPLPMTLSVSLVISTTTHHVDSRRQTSSGVAIFSCRSPHSIPNDRAADIQDTHGGRAPPMEKCGTPGGENPTAAGRRMGE